MKKTLLYLGLIVVAVFMAIALSAFYGKSPDASFIAHQREWFGSVALRISIVRVSIFGILWFLATFTYVDKTANYFRTNRDVVVKTRYRLLFWYLAFEIVFMMAYLR